MVGADSCRRWEFPTVFDGKWAMHNGVQVPVANRSWLLPEAIVEYLERFKNATIQIKSHSYDVYGKL